MLTKYIYVLNSNINTKSQDSRLTCCWGGADAGGAAADPGLLAASPPPAAAAGAPLPRATPRPLARPVILNGGVGGLNEIILNLQEKYIISHIGTFHSSKFIDTLIMTQTDSYDYGC